MKKSILTLITVLLAGLSTAWGQNVAKIGSTEYGTLTAAFEAVQDGETITLLKDITTSSTITINKSVTIDGAGFEVSSSSANPFTLSGFNTSETNSVTFNNVKVKATGSNLRGIVVNQFAGTLTLTDCTLTVSQRGVTYGEYNKNINLVISNTTIENRSVTDPTTQYTNNDSRGLSIWTTNNTPKNTVKLTNTIIKGFAYSINVAGGGTGVTEVTMNGGATYGRAAINNWNDNNKFTLTDVDIHGLNNQTGPTERFACIIDNNENGQSADNNVYNVTDCTFTATVSNEAIAGGNAAQLMFALRGQNSKANIHGNTTYSSTCPDESRVGLIEWESQLVPSAEGGLNNKFVFDADAQQSLAEEIAKTSITVDADGNGTTTYVAQIGTKKYTSLAEAFAAATNGCTITLLKDVTLSSDVTCQLTDGQSFYLKLNGHNLDRNGKTITLSNGVSVLTDAEVDGLFACEAGCGIVKSESGDATHPYKYSAETGVAQIGNTIYSTLAAAINAAQDGETILLLSDIGSYDSNANPTYTTEGMSTVDSRFNYWINKSITIDGDGGDTYYSIYVKGRGFGITGESSPINVTFKNVIVSNVGNVNGRCIDTRGNLNSLTLDNVYLTTNESSYTGYLQPLTIGGNQSSTATVTINNSGITTVDDANKGYAITTFNPVNMTITDSQISGWACLNIKGADSSAGSAGSTITVNGGSMTSANGTPGYTNAYSLIKIEDDNVNVSVTNCEINVNGGDNTQSIVSFQKPGLTSSENSHVSLGVGNEVILEGDYKFESNAGTSSGLEVSGGKFNVRVPADVIAEGLICPTEANEDNGTMWSLVQGTYVAMIGEYGYETLPAAFAAVQDGETIKLLADITLTDRLFVNAGETPAYAGTGNRYATTSDNKRIMLDMNGKNITSSSNIALAGGSLNITNTGTADDTHGVISTTTAGLAPIEVRGTGNLTAKRTLTIGTGVTLSGAEYGLNIFGSNTADVNKIDVNVNGTVKGMLFVLGNLKNTANEININVAGTVDASGANGTEEKVHTGIALNGYADVTVSGNAVVKGESGIEARAGSLTVNGGTITGTADSYHYEANGNGTTTKGAAIAVAQHGTALPVAVSLEGGSLSGKELIAVTDVNNNSLSGVSVIASPNFVENKATTLPPDKAWAKNGDGNYVIVSAVASIGTTGYATLKDAFDAVQNGQTIKLLTVVTLTENITCPLESGTISIDVDPHSSTKTRKINASNKSILFKSGVTVNVVMQSGDAALNFRPMYIKPVSQTDMAALHWRSADAKTYTVQIVSKGSVDYVDADGAAQTATEAVPLPTTAGGAVLFLDNAWYYTQGDLTLTTMRFTDNGPVTNIVLTDGHTLTANQFAGNGSQGNLTIYGQTVQSGKLSLPVAGDRSFILKNYTQNGGVVDAKAGMQVQQAVVITAGEFNIQGSNTSTPLIARSGGTTTTEGTSFTVTGGKVNVNATGSYGVAVRTKDVRISGGQVTLTGNSTNALDASTITLSLEEPEDYSFNEDFIKVSSYNGAVRINGILYDEYTDKDFSGAIANNDDLKNTKLIVGRTVAVIGDKRFHTLQAAINAISNDGMPRTIQLVNDINGENTIAKQKQIVIAESNKKITIDLNGHTILAQEAEFFKVTGNNVDLTFTGNGEMVNVENGYLGVSMRGEGGHLTIGGGVTLTEGTVFVRGKNNVVDVNGKINVTGEQAAIQTNGQDTNTGNVINVNDPAEVTSATDNAIYAAGDANYNINGGKVTGATAIYQKGGKLTVTDGTITGNGEKKPFEHNDNGANPTGDAIVVENCNYPAGIPEVAIKGGTIISDNASPVASYFTEGYDPVKGFISAGTYNKNNVEADLLAQGYVMQPDGNGMYTPVPGAGVAKIGDVYYATLDAAIAAVPTTGVETKIELLTNINATKRTVIPSNTNIVLDLGGYTLRCDNDFTISDFEGNAGEETSVTSNAQLTIQNGTVTSKEKYAIRLGGNGNTVEIAEDAVIKAGANTDYAVVLRGENNTFEINGTVEVAHGTAISTNGSDANKNNKIVINEPAKIYSPDYIALYLPSGALTVNGGTITGATGIYFKSKNLVIPANSTAVITGNGAQKDVEYNGNGGFNTGDAVVVDNAAYPEGEPLADIAGGTFVSTNAMPIASYATKTGMTAPTKFVSGGKFSEQIPVAVIAEGFICPSKPNVDSYYMLITGSYEAEVDGMGYETFAKAVEAADEGDVITLLNNVAEPYTMQEGQTLKVAKNGKTITMQTPSSNYRISETTNGDVTTYFLRKSIKALTFPTNIESYFTGEAQDVPLVITDGDYTLVPGVDYVFIEGDNTTSDFKKTNVGKYTFEAKGIGKYFNHQPVNWTILKSLNYETITITINPAIYNGSQKDPKDFITVKDDNTTLVAGTHYKIVTKGGPFTDAKAYIDAVSIIGLKEAFIGDTIVTDFIINPMDVKDYSVSVSVLYRSEGYTVDKANSKDEVKTAPSYTLTFKDMSGNTVDVSNYDVTIADGFYRDVQRYDYTVIVTPIGDNTNVTGRLVGPLYINPGDAIDISQCLVTSKAVYNSFSQEPSYSTIEVVYKNGSNKVVLTENDFTVDYHGMMSGYVDAQTYSNAMTLKGIGNFYGSLDADYVIEPRDLADTNYNDDLVEVKAEPGKALQWTGSDLTNSIAIGDMPGGNTDAQNNIYLYMKVKDNGYRYALKAADYSYTVEPSPMVDPGEYKVLFTGRGNFTGMREVKVNVLKDINLITDGINVGLQVIPNNYRLYVKDLKNIEVKDGDQTLVEGVHYTLEVKGARSATAPYTYGENFSNPNAAAPEVYNEYIQYKGLLYAFFKGKEPYYNETVVKEFPVLYEYYAYDDENTCYNKKANGDYQSSGWDINDNANRFSFRVKPGKVTRVGNTWSFEGGEATVTAIDGIKNGTYSKTALDPAKEICAIDSKVNIAVGNQNAGTYKKLVFNLVGVEDNAFRDLPKLHCLDLTAIKGYAPENLSRTSSAPFNYIAKQALVYLNSNAVNGENYVYKVADNDYRCEELKIYEDVQGDQLGFTGEDYKWTFKNMYEFLAQKVTNTRVLTAGKHYTTCLPYSIPQVDFKAYTLDASSSNLLGFKEVPGSLEALTPYVVIPEETGKLFSATEVTIPVTGTITGNQFAPYNDEEMAKFGNNVTPTVGGHKLLGTLRYMDKDEAAGMYIMQADKKWKKVGDATSTYNGPCILPMRAYIGGPAAVTPSGSRTIGAEFTNIDGTVISLDDVKFNEDDNVYDLQGRRVETPRKGNVYIINGKKQQWR